MERRRRPRAVTLMLPDKDHPYVVLNGQKYALRNFSEEGIGIWMPSSPPYGLNKGNRISGDVVIDNQIFPVQLEVVRHSNKIMGFCITDQSQELKDIFYKLLEPTRYASKLEEHLDSRQKEQDSGLIKLWLIGPHGTELLVWCNGQNGEMIQLQLCWAGKWVYKIRKQRVQTGLLRQLERECPGFLVNDTELIVRHRYPDPELIHDALSFLSAAPHPWPGQEFMKFVEADEAICLPHCLLTSKKES